MPAFFCLPSVDHTGDHGWIKSHQWTELFYLLFLLIFPNIFLNNIYVMSISALVDMK